MPWVLILKVCRLLSSASELTRPPGSWLRFVSQPRALSLECLRAVEVLCICTTTSTFAHLGNALSAWYWVLSCRSRRDRPRVPDFIDEVALVASKLDVRCPQHVWSAVPKLCMSGFS